MRPLDMLERWLRPVAMPYLAPVLAAAQVVVFVWVALSSAQQPLLVLEPMMLIPDRVLDGEWWRLLTYLAVPCSLHPLWAILGWFALVFFGGALEQHWGTARFNLFLILGWFATSAAAFITPAQPTGNGFIIVSVFLAFATLAPEMVIRVLLVIPVKAKWLAAFTWVLLAIALIDGPWSTRIAVLSSVANWSAFFLPMVMRQVGLVASRPRRAVGHAAAGVTSGAITPFHRCTVCGRTDVSDPQLEFRYCGECDGAPGYCMEHLHAHEHIRKKRGAESVGTGS